MLKKALLSLGLLIAVAVPVSLIADLEILPPDLNKINEVAIFDTETNMVTRYEVEKLPAEILDGRIKTMTKDEVQALAKKIIASARAIKSYDIKPSELAKAKSDDQCCGLWGWTCWRPIVRWAWGCCGCYYGWGWPCWGYGFWC